jgi:hypothetical protein
MLDPFPLYNRAMNSEQRFERIEADLAGAAANLRVVTETLGELTQAMTRYVESSNDRMTRLEANLDGLIRAITAEHSNGQNGK